ncbi:MAG: Trk system potassium transporter TrkA [Acidobacteria bacterium]|nr:Trk system potassium transporter TrkA [Acidobacteriota bacterium]MCH8971091.1 Trk system potassium transporter TrkA [Acidobacteriota bacterium]MCZ6505191.1 Trk system potassium transporter TrkA [Actinomycetota bacterium]TDI37636.1 MAG: Trk system potassium transporter TrkA [Acidobacteriota bacterium]
MRIIIVGAGAVGSYLAERLSAEGQDVVVIEYDEKRATQLQESIDALVLTGNGASKHLLEEAEADKSDLLIAVSNSDGANVLACFTATELGTKTTIARIEDPELREGADRLGVDVVIDPSATTAEELVSIVGIGGASEVIQFADGKLVMVGGIVSPNAAITDGPLRDLRIRQAEWGWVVAALVRDGRTIVAHGDTVVRAGDHALLMTTDDRVAEATRILGLKRRNLDRAIIMGGTRLAELTADAMSEAGVSVVIVEEDMDRCSDLASHHPQALVICGDPTDPDVLGDLDLGPKDVAIGLTGWDEVNLLGCLVAKASGAGMAISRFNRISYVGLLSGLGIDAAVSSRLMAASAILRFVRKGKVEQVATFSDTDAEALEIEVSAGSEACNKTLFDLNLPIGVIIGGISRDGTTFVPDGSTVVRSGDHIIFFSLPRDIEESVALFTA